MLAIAGLQGFPSKYNMAESMVLQQQASTRSRFSLIVSMDCQVMSHERFTHDYSLARFQEFFLPPKAPQVPPELGLGSMPEEATQTGGCLLGVMNKLMTEVVNDTDVEKLFESIIDEQFPLFAHVPEMVPEPFPSQVGGWNLDIPHPDDSPSPEPPEGPQSPFDKMPKIPDLPEDTETDDEEQLARKRREREEIQQQKEERAAAEKEYTAQIEKQQAEAGAAREAAMAAAEEARQEAEAKALADAEAERQAAEERERGERRQGLAIQDDFMQMVENILDNTLFNLIREDHRQGGIL
ncbi:hypothetical protein CYMTET_29683 [Cymbomonas tetramitiformis]|uniref:Uncharacterized protein n=1 Tax=Cymbomonas tetramitiformis TaxID=36881 RepID=A0AAE0KUP0_9CHLO|nr:hypothetical protein CYMTET_29683 [Cymbomonas tetramitiformis]